MKVTKAFEWHQQKYNEHDEDNDNNKGHKENNNKKSDGVEKNSEKKGKKAEIGITWICVFEKAWGDKVAKTMPIGRMRTYDKRSRGERSRGDRSKGEKRKGERGDEERGRGGA